VATRSREGLPEGTICEMMLLLAARYCRSQSPALLPFDHRSTPVAQLQHHVYQKTVQDLVHLYERRLLNLSPGFQRDSVWSDRDRAKLIDTMVRGWPLPAIFLYKRQSDGENVYDVIDGKQRIESIFRFTGTIRGGRFATRVQLPGSDDSERVDWSMLRRKSKQHIVTGYNISTVEVDGDLGEIIDLFVRINSTGKALSAAEKRHARFYNSPFLREASRLAARWETYFRENRIVTAGQVSRMKHVELACELMVSMHKGDIINKKAALDKVMSTEEVTRARTAMASNRTTRALKCVKRMFPDLAQTRFHQLSDFYTLVVLISKFDAQNLILTDRRRNKLAWGLLVSLSNGVDDLRVRQKKLMTQVGEAEIYRDYLLTVLEGTDEISKRQRREEILRGLLENVFRRRDSERLFSPEQRRVLWNTAEDRRCAICRKPVTWADLTIDHISPFSKGGRTSLKNAALTHRRCNSKKGAR
jgi:hypothetical protein